MTNPYSENEITDVKEALVDGMHYHSNHFPKRECLEIYDSEIDFEFNQDFSLWELDMEKR
jgi:hypothetical protein